MKGDFFTRLAERTLGFAPVVKPDLTPTIASTLESTAVGNLIAPLEETQGEASATDRMQPEPRGDSPAPAPNGTEFAIARADTPHGPARSREAPLDLPIRNIELPDRDLEAPDRVSNAAARRESRPTGETVEIERSMVRRGIATRGKMSLAEITDRVYATPAAAPAPSPQAVKAPAASIQISIGSVEVRAVLPPAPAPRAVERQAAARLSLEQYLRERNGRRR